MVTVVLWDGELALKSLSEVKPFVPRSRMAATGSGAGRGIARHP
jgi:hypothetical protein